MNMLRNLGPMLYSAKFLLAPVAALAIVSNLGCIGTYEQPYQPVSISDLVNDESLKGSWVGVSGLPLNCGYSSGDICSLIDPEGNNVLYLRRTDSNTMDSDYTAAETAFQNEANDGDNDQIRVFGRYEGNNDLLTEYFFIDDILYPVEQ